LRHPDKLTDATLSKFCKPDSIMLRAAIKKFTGQEASQPEVKNYEQEITEMIRGRWLTLAR